jgi:Lrp/AsnC family transcriptional regulator, leucine-responsive regulatory protein
MRKIVPTPDLDDSDRRLLRLVQKDARASTQTLADAAGMSASPAWRRLKRLEDEAVIVGHVALLDARKLGFHTLAYVEVSLTEHSEATVRQFDNFVAGQPQILECARVSGSGDYLLKVVAEDNEDLERFLMRQLLATGVVRDTTTSIVLRQTKSTTELPV